MSSEDLGGWLTKTRLLLMDAGVRVSTVMDEWSGPGSSRMELDEVRDILGGVISEIDGRLVRYGNARKAVQARLRSAGRLPTENPVD